MNRTVLTIGGFDSSGGAGIAADLKTFQAFRCYGTAVITAITAQNTVEVQAVHPVPMEIVGQQIEAIVSDMTIHAVKTGMMSTAENVEITATLLKTFNLTQYLVVDPVIKASTGTPLITDEGIKKFKSKLIPIAFCVTPNLMEAEALSGIEVKNISQIKDAAKAIFDMGVQNVIVTGGHLDGPSCIDTWYDGKRFYTFDAQRVSTNNTHGVGCTFASIIAALMTKGMLLGEAIDRAKKYIAKAMNHPFQIGKGSGPLNHTIPM